MSQIVDGVNGRQTRGMSYDGLDRLTQTTSSMFGTASYADDVLDNLAQVSVGGGSQVRNHYYCYDVLDNLTQVAVSGGSAASTRPERIACLHRPPVGNVEGVAMAYVDGFVLPVPVARLGDYRKLARKAGKVWLEYGALQYMECIADDVQPGKLTSFPQAVKLKPDEIVVFSWIVYKSRAHRDKVNRQVMADPRIASMDPKSMPFDGKRMFWGGFKPVVSFG